MTIESRGNVTLPNEALIISCSTMLIFKEEDLD